MKGKKFEFTTPWGKTYAFFQLSIEDAKERIESHQGVPLKDFKKYLNHCEVYKLNNDEVVMTSYADATVYESQEGFLASMQVSGLIVEKHIPTSFPIQKIQYSLDNRRITYYLIGEAEGIVRKNAAWLLPETDPPIYLTQENEILQPTGKKTNFYILYQSRKDYDDLKAFRTLQNKIFTDPNFKKNHAQINPQLKGLNPFGVSFPDHVEELITRLPFLLDCSPEIFTETINSFPKIEHHLYKNLITADFSDKIFLPLLSYLGKVHVVHLGGKWEMCHDTYFDHWFPDIRNQEKKLVRMYLRLGKILDSTSTEWYPLKTVLYR